MCLKHFFTPIGTLFLGLLIGLSILVPGVIGAAKDLADGVKALSDSLDLNFVELINSLAESVAALDWSDPLSALEIMIEREWLLSTVENAVNALLGTNVGEFMTGISALTEAFAGSVLIYLIVLALWAVIGLIGGYFLTRFLVRRTIAKRRWWKFILVAFFDSILSATLISACVWLLSVWKPSIVITSVLSVLLMGFVYFLEAYLTYALGKVKFKDIVNIKNILLLIASNILIMVIAAALVAIAALLINSVAGIVIGMSLAEIAFITSSMNAESYVIGEVDKSIEAEGKPLPLEPLF